MRDETAGERRRARRVSGRCFLAGRTDDCSDPVNVDLVTVKPWRTRRRASLHSLGRLRNGFDAI